MKKSRLRRKRLLNTPAPAKKKGMTWVWIGIGICLILLSFIVFSPSHPTAVPLGVVPSKGHSRAELELQAKQFTEQQMVDLYKELIDAINPARPENAYMPPFMRSTIGSAIALNLKKPPQFTFDYKPALHPKDANAMMSAIFVGETPGISAYMAKIITKLRIDKGIRIGFDQEFKNDFAVAFTHECIHLEKGKTYLEAKHSRKENEREEMRTWTKMSELAVHPLRLRNQPLSSMNLLADDILQRCNYHPECPEFREFLLPRVIDPQAAPR